MMGPTGEGERGYAESGLSACAEESAGAGNGGAENVCATGVDEGVDKQQPNATEADVETEVRPRSTLKGLSREDCEALAFRVASTAGIGEGSFTLFDILRTPRTVPAPAEATLQSTARLSASGLSEDLACPICRGTYRQVMVVKDCLHRFCSECIERWLRSGRQDCPQCRAKIGSRRALRQDPIFQAMVFRLFPDVSEFETRNDELIYEANKRRSLGESCASNLHLASLGRGRTPLSAHNNHKAKGSSSTLDCPGNGRDCSDGKRSSPGAVPTTTDLVSPPSSAASESVPPASVKEAVEASYARQEDRSTRGGRKQRRLSGSLCHLPLSAMS